MKKLVYNTKTKTFANIPELGTIGGYYLAEHSKLGHSPASMSVIKTLIVDCSKDAAQEYKDKGYDILVFDNIESRRNYREAMRKLMVVQNGNMESNLEAIISEASKHIIKRF